MKLSIPYRISPFTHKRAVKCLIPHTRLQLQAFPTKIILKDLVTGDEMEQSLGWRGPVEGFTVQMELQEGSVYIFAKTLEGFRRLVIKASLQGVILLWEKEKKQLLIPHSSFFPSNPIQKLSLGKHTKLDWELVCRRLDLQEIIPVVFLLSQKIPSEPGKSPLFDLLIFQDKQAVYDQLKQLFLAGFYDLLMPRIEDTDFQGIIPWGLGVGSVLSLFPKLFSAIRSLFFQEEEQKWHFLPLLPPQFHAGKMIDCITSSNDCVSFEWSKKILREVVIAPKSTRMIELSLQKPLTTFRVNKTHTQLAREPLHLVAGKTIFLDRFQK